MSTVSPNGYGITTTPARLVPDVSLLASPNFPGYLVCTQNFNEEGTATGSSCDSPTTGIQDMLNGCFAGTGNCSIFGGTSVSTPIFAGIVTLLNQYTAANSIPSPVGNINPNLYTLAASNSTNHAFNPVTTASTGSYSDGAFCEEGFPSSGSKAIRGPPRWCARAAAHLLGSSATTPITPTQPPTTASPPALVQSMSATSLPLGPRGTSPPPPPRSSPARIRPNMATQSPSPPLSPHKWQRPLRPAP